MSTEHGRPTDAGSAGRWCDRVLTWPQVAALVPYTRQHLGRLEAAGRFPQRLQIGPGRVGWWESEVLGWLRERRRGALRPLAVHGRSTPGTAKATTSGDPKAARATGQAGERP